MQIDENSVRDYILQNENLPYNDLIALISQTLLSFTRSDDMSKRIRGMLGEMAVHYTVKESKKFLNYEITQFNGFILRKKDKRTTEIDNIIITPYYIGVIETKSYYGDITVDNTGIFNIKIGNKTSTYDPFLQNENHCSHLYKELYKFIPEGDSSYIKPITCIVSRCTLQDYRTNSFRDKYPVVTLPNLMQLLISLPNNRQQLDMYNLSDYLYKIDVSKTPDGRKNHILSLGGKIWEII